MAFQPQITQQGYSVCLAHFATFCRTGSLVPSQELLLSLARTVLVLEWPSLLGHPVVPLIMSTPTEGILQSPKELIMWYSASLEGLQYFFWLQNVTITLAFSETKLALTRLINSHAPQIHSYQYTTHSPKCHHDPRQVPRLFPTFLVQDTLP